MCNREQRREEIGERREERERAYMSAMTGIMGSTMEEPRRSITTEKYTL
jgi:hypothetical protein